MFLARDLVLGRRVAIKFLHSDQPERTRRLLEEARATARCRHDNIVVIYEVGEHEGTPYIVLEYLHGKPLSALIERGEYLSIARAVEIMCAVLRALSCAHEAGIVHRDLKPDNIIVTEGGTIKVLDFGIAKMRPPTPGPQLELLADLHHTSGEVTRELHGGSQPSHESDEMIAGTLQYMAPEQWGTSIKIDHLTDIWACGLLLHQMICGRHPLPPDQLITTASLEQAMPSMAEAAPPGAPCELIRVVDRCLRKGKVQRWQSAAELLVALEPFLEPHRRSELHIDESPYAGLAPFQERDAGKFFGRNQEIAALVAQVRDRPLMAVVGSSGIGKSSFVRAGLIPALKRSGEKWEALILRPGRHPIEALASMLRAASSTPTGVTDELEAQRQLAQVLRREPGVLGHMLRVRAKRGGLRMLLYVDQLDELYTQVADPTERMAFTACLSAAADDVTSPLRVVLSIRSDFLDRLTEDRPFVAELAHGLFFLGPPSREGMRDAITNPAELAGYQLEPAVVEDMLAYLDTVPGNALPLLQFAAARLWDTRDKARRWLTQASYVEMGGVAGALASHADRVVRELGSEKVPLVRAILLRLVTADGTRAVMPLADLRDLSRKAGEIQRLIDHLVAARLLVVQALEGNEGNQGTTVEIVHESLVRGWPALRRWLEENQEDVALLHQLRTAARQWAGKGRDPGLLWHGDIAGEARMFRSRYKGPLSDIERAFLDAIDHRERAVQRRRHAFVIAGLTLLSLVMVSSIALVIVFQRASQREREHNKALININEELERQLVLVRQGRLELVEAKTKERTIQESMATLSNLFHKSKAELVNENGQLQIEMQELQLKVAEAAAATRMARELADKAKEEAAMEGQRMKDMVNAARADAMRQRQAVAHLLEQNRSLRAGKPPSIGSSPEAPSGERRPITVASTTVTRLSGDKPAIDETKLEQIPSPVIVKVCIDTRGQVSHIGVDAKLDSIATELRSAIRGWKYKPYQPQGMAIPACFFVPFEFQHRHERVGRSR